MSMHLLSSLRRALFASYPSASKQRKRATQYRRTLSMERLECRQMLSITPLSTISTNQDTSAKPQSKVFQYANEWWSVLPTSTGTWVYRLDGTTWTQTQRISTSTTTHADVKVVNDRAYVLLFDGVNSQLASLQYDGADNRFEPWSLQPQLVNITFSTGVETATLEVDSTGRMWIASDAVNSIEVRYSDLLYTHFSAPITVATGVTTDDISAIVQMTNNQLGVFWSNQNAKVFGFRLHVDGTDPTQWTTDERPGSQSALIIGHGLADDHIHMAVSSDGTLYVAAKTSYDKSGYAKMILLVRRPNGTWDNVYDVDGNGTRPVVVVDEAAGKVIIAYESTEGGGPILYRESDLGTINLSPVQVMMSGTLANVTSTKVTSTDEIVFMASGHSVLFKFDTTDPLPPPPPPPLESSAGGERGAGRHGCHWLASSAQWYGDR